MIDELAKESRNRSMNDKCTRDEQGHGNQNNKQV